MRSYGVNENITDSFLYSKIKIIEAILRFSSFIVFENNLIQKKIIQQIYKMLNFSSKLKEKYLCDPVDAVSFFKASDYFYHSYPTKINATLSADNKTVGKPLSPEQIANQNLASIICKVSKRQLISDAEYLSKEINYVSISNYV